MNPDSLTPPSAAEPSLTVAERQLAMLGEMAQMTLVVSRAYAHAAVAASHAVEVILADEYWQPETGRARALAGAKDAADSFQKASRSLRLTLVLEAATADTVRDLRAGILPERKPAVIPKLVLAPLGNGGGAADVDSPETDVEAREPHTDRLGREFERLVEFDRPDRPYPGGFRSTVNGVCAEIGAAIDWESETFTAPDLNYAPLQPRPPGWSECRPPADYKGHSQQRPPEGEMALPPLQGSEAPRARP